MRMLAGRTERGCFSMLDLLISWGHCQALPLAVASCQLVVYKVSLVLTLCVLPDRTSTLIRQRSRLLLFDFLPWSRTVILPRTADTRFVLQPTTTSRKQICSSQRSPRPCYFSLPQSPPLQRHKHKQQAPQSINQPSSSPTANSALPSGKPTAKATASQ
jgi:hypothetical protein